MFKIDKSRGKFTVELYSKYNKFLWSAGGFSSKQAALKNIRATMQVMGSNIVNVQDNSILTPKVYKVSQKDVRETNLRLWK